MVYMISDDSIKKASKYGLVLKPSLNKRYKIDAYFNNHLINSFGQYGANDFHTYKKYEKLGLYPKGHANERKRLYYIRHPKNGDIFSKDWLSKYILWT